MRASRRRDRDATAQRLAVSAGLGARLSSTRRARARAGGGAGEGESERDAAPRAGADRRGPSPGSLGASGQLAARVAVACTMNCPAAASMYVARFSPLGVRLIITSII